VTGSWAAELQALLQGWDPPVGDRGFEGMVAVALAEVAGLPIRLARSGSQFGRDGLSVPGDFVIAFEAKRYTKRPTLQELGSKAALAIDDLDDRVEIWACAVPADLGDLAGRLAAILDKAGMTLLALDWPTGGLSSLAVLLAGARTRVSEWARSIGRHSDADKLDRLLGDVARDPRFAAVLARMKAELTQSTTGMAALAARNGEWARDILAEPLKAREIFGQGIAPANAAHPAIARDAARRELKAAAGSEGAGLTIVLGGDGSGKSWLVADWWMQQAEPPVLIFAAGPLHAALDCDRTGETMLAALLARAHGGQPERWQHRIARWRRWGDGRKRFALVIDGLNERASGKKWATIIDALVPVVAELGGTVIATCRPAYWRQNVSGRLRAPVREVTLGDFETGELRAFFEAHGLSLDDLPADLHAFLANPRVAALAVRVLPRLPATQILSRDRLLLEYWRARIEDRGDLAAHNDDEFGDLLAEHAKQFRDKGSARFERSRLAQLSAHVVLGGRSYADDIAELADGHFFAPRPSGYEMTGEALPTALGLLLHRELSQAEPPDYESALGLVDAALEPVSGFDEIANAVAACIALGLSGDSLPRHMVVALIVAWFGIQNRNDDAYRSIEASARAESAPFLDAFEAMTGDLDDRPLLELLHEMRDEAAIWAAISARLSGWLGSWLPQGERWGSDEDARARAEERTAQIAERRALLRPAEVEMLERVTCERPDDGRLAKAAIQLALGMPLAGFADGIAGYCLVAALKAHNANVHELFCWLLRSNGQDFEETHRAVRAAIAPLCADDASASARRAAAIALEALGRHQDAGEARHLWPRANPRTWRSADVLCDVEPLDPHSGPPGNLANARDAGQSLDPAAVWTSFSSTIEDHRLSEIAAPLVRFDPEHYVSLMRSIVRTGPERRAMALRQLAWHLPDLSPLFEASDLDAVRRTMAGLTADGAEVEDKDRWWITACVAEAILPHLPFDERVELVQELPCRVALYDRLARHPAEADAAGIERLLVQVQGDGPLRISRTLHQLTVVEPVLTSRSRALIVGWLAHANRTVAGLAANIVRRAGDDELDQMALASGALEARTENGFLAANRSAAFASAVVRQRRDDLVSRVSPVDLGWVASRLGGQTLDQFRDAIDHALDVLLRPLATPVPETIDVRVETDEDGRERRYSFTVREVDDEGDSLAGLTAALDSASPDAWDNQQRMGRAELTEFVHGITLEGAGMLIHANWLHGLDAVVDADPDHARRWAQRILSSEASGCDQTQAIGAALAAVLARHDSALAIRLFGRVMKARAIVDTLIGSARIPLRFHALFRAPSDPDLNAFRGDLLVAARSDAEIEAIVAAATAHGAETALDAIVANLVESPIPARHALALTVTGFRVPSEAGDRLLARDWGQGYLGEVAGRARDAVQRARWYEHWRDRALAADDPVAFWRAGELAARCVDRRGLFERPTARAGSPAWLHQEVWREQLVKGAGARTKTREGLLHGRKRPFR